MTTVTYRTIKLKKYYKTERSSRYFTKGEVVQYFKSDFSNSPLFRSLATGLIQNFPIRDIRELTKEERQTIPRDYHEKYLRRK